MPFDELNIFSLPIDNKNMLSLIPDNSGDDTKIVVRKNFDEIEGSLERLTSIYYQYQNSERVLLGNDKSLQEFLRNKNQF